LIVVNTKISWGYLELLQIFAKANSLVLKFDPYSEPDPLREYTRISYEEGSDTSVAITFLSIKHLGFENMLCDYLIRCNIDPIMIPIGKAVMRKTPEQMEKEWQEHRKKIGLTR